MKHRRTSAQFTYSNLSCPPTSTGRVVQAVSLCALVLLVGCQPPATGRDEQATGVGRGTRELPPDRSAEPSGVALTPSVDGQLGRDPQGVEGGKQSSPAAKQLLAKVIDGYRKADEYQDQGKVILRYRRAGESFVDTAALRLAFVRGNSLLLGAYGAEILAHQGLLSAQLEDPATNHFDHQMLVRPLSASRFQLADIYVDPTLNHFASAGLGGPAVQLELLLSPDPLAGLFHESTILQLGPSDEVDGCKCQAVIIESTPLQYRLWIDQETGHLRRIELPSQSAGLAADPAVSDVSLTIELTGARWSVPKDFSWQLTRRIVTQQVRHFVVPPPPLASPLLGEIPKPFQFHSLDRQVAIAQHGSDRELTVLLWIVDHPGCQMAAQELQRIAEKVLATSTPQRVRFAVVAAEPSWFAEEGKALRAMQSWRVGLPLVLDTSAVGRDVFGILEAPTLVVLGKEGVVEWFQPRVGPEMAAGVPALLTDLLEGKKVGTAQREEYQMNLATYNRLLQEARAEGGRDRPQSSREPQESLPSPPP